MRLFLISQCFIPNFFAKKNQFLDFDDELVEEVFDFLENTVQSSGHLAMVNLIGSLLSEKVEERNALSAKVNLLAEHIHLNDTLRAPIDLLMSFPVDEIARQMTLIDIALLRKIQVFSHNHVFIVCITLTHYVVS